jgi:hypothetical protein
MQSSSPRHSPLLRLGLLLLTAGCFAACDRHPAVEVRRDYGHGSSHEKSYSNHSIDSTSGGKHFSDSAGVGTEKKGEAQPAAEKH